MLEHPPSPDSPVSDPARRAAWSGPVQFLLAMETGLACFGNPEPSKCAAVQGSPQLRPDFCHR
eukprot:888279-Rhodomonas_salina.1